jgi:hypothetical protein
MNPALLVLLTAALNNAQVIAKLVTDAHNGVQHTDADLDALTNSIQQQSDQIQQLRTDK